MKLTNRIIARLWEALNDLDGEKKPDGTIEVRFSFKGTALYAFARTINHLRGHQTAVQKTSDGIVLKHANGKNGIARNDPAFAACEAEINELLDSEAEVEVHRVKLVDLDLDKNHLRPATLAALLETIVDAE